MSHEPGGDVAIVGAGIIGLSVAFELASRGAHVRVFDTGEPAKAASWAAAGMLAPYTERIPDEPLQRLCESSLSLFPSFAQTITNASGIDPHLKLDGVVDAAYTQEHYERLQRRARELAEGGREATLLDRERTLAAEPALSRTVAGALLVHGEGQVDNRRLGRALIAACETQGVRIQTGVESLLIECDPRRVLGVRTDRGFFPAAAIVNAAGAWASRVAGVPQECIPPIHPVKGQMLAIEIPVGFVRRTTWIPGGYFVPRQDGRLLVGATAENAGYDSRVTAGGIHTLLQSAVTAAPSLRDFTVSEAWAGLRPGTPDERPFLGPTSLTGYFLAAGHYRNGILLAPATARMLADMIEIGRGDGISDFSLERRRESRESVHQR
ncbi:MAG TPA: glycine oxidase ThiO [Candidatus Baltobacteraceae bacterium]|nr:glycine oxidase ThiO [Candidatus Baltobacteraceae bacterium]